MECIQLPDEFKGFLKCLNSNAAEYLVIGGFAVAFHGYQRNTGDIDIWVPITPRNAKRVAGALVEFGFSDEDAEPKLFSKRNKIVRIGMPPLRIEILTSISGVKFRECFERRIVQDIDGIQVSFIGLADLRKNKKASGRPDDLIDLEHLGPPKRAPQRPKPPRRPKR